MDSAQPLNQVVLSVHRARLIESSEAQAVTELLKLAPATAVLLTLDRGRARHCRGGGASRASAARRPPQGLPLVLRSYSSLDFQVMLYRCCWAAPGPQKL